MERAVRWVIITIIFVFDPLAVLLLIAANFSLKRRFGWDFEDLAVAEQPVTDKPTPEPEKKSVVF